MRKRVKDAEEVVARARARRARGAAGARAREENVDDLVASQSRTRLTCFLP
jgi:hypothetical protein